MRHFVKLCEYARSGISANIFRNGEQVRVKFPMDEKISQWLEQTQPIVFVTDKEILDQEIPEKNEWGHAHGKIDAPFKFFSIEKLNGPLLVSPDCEISEEFRLWCVAANEVSPNEYRFLSLIERVKSGDWSVAATNSEIDVINNFLVLFSKQEVGILPSRETVKLGSGATKRIHRIRRIIYVSPKKEMESITKNHRNIDWSHRWLVRGHWRNIGDKLGKDREGNYCVKGFTWVTEFEKGPESAPLITKTRIVTENK